MWPKCSLAELATAITGFDIDPLAVLLARTTWVITLKDEIRASSESVTIPVFHADSLFAITPSTRSLPMVGGDASLTIELDGVGIPVPSELIAPAFQPLFDGIVDWCYDEANAAKSRGSLALITKERAGRLVESLAARHRLDIADDLLNSLFDTVATLANRMSELAVANRNGIWAFILRNAYRPGLLAGQFNGLVSNPPWLAMSQFANNPYKVQLSDRALLYGIKPSGAAHLHLELATTHLLHAIDRYLQPQAAVACLLPGTILNGQHHAKFRGGAYLNATRRVPFELREVWAIAPGTFKLRSAAVIGIKNTPESLSVVEGYAATPTGLVSTDFNRIQLGERSAWVLGSTRDQATLGAEDNVPPQGADLMPRTAVCVRILERNGPEWRVDTPQRGDADFFAVQDGKKLIGEWFPGWVSPRFIHLMVQSRNLLPFILDGHYVPVAIPAVRTSDGQWEPMNTAEIRDGGFLQTARRFERINEAMKKSSVVMQLQNKIDERGKLTRQVFPSRGYLVVNGAGGGIACAASLALEDLPNIVVDQTLYWMVASTEDEAWYRVGLMNSKAVTDIIREFNPSGAFGERHLHTLPKSGNPAVRGGRSQPCVSLILSSQAG